MSKLCSIIFIALLAASLQGSPSYAKDAITLTKPDREVQGRLLRSYDPRERTPRKVPIPVTPETVQNTVDNHIRALFARATDPSTNHVTIESAKAAGIGYFVDNFARIDTDRDSSLSYGEVKGLLDTQSPIVRHTPSARPVDKEIQFIE